MLGSDVVGGGTNLKDADTYSDHRKGTMSNWYSRRAARHLREQV